MKDAKTPLKCVMLVDDDALTNEVHRMVLEEMGISRNVQIALSADEALELLEANKIKDCQTPDLILLDLNMPGMDGWDFLESYREKMKTRPAKTIIILLTNSNNPLDRQKAESYEEVVAFKNKPLTEVMVNEILGAHFSAA